MRRAVLPTAAAALLAFGMAAPAAADEAERTKATYNYKGQSGISIKMNGEEGVSGTKLFDLNLAEGGKLRTYCIDLETPIPLDMGSVPYVEGDWADYPGEGEFVAQSGKVLSVLQQGFPKTDLAGLRTAAGQPRLTEAEAIAGTQAAIWHFSNGSEFTGLDGTRDRNIEPRIRAVYDHLVDNAEDLTEPEPALKIDPGTAEGTAGEIVGEFTVTTDAEALELVESADNPEGVSLVYVETGELVETVTDGDVLGFAVPEDAEPGTAGFTLTGTSTVFAGRLFQGDGTKTQTLITADDGEATVTASVSASWGAVDGPEPEPEPEPTPDPEPTPEPTPDTEEPGGKPTPTDEPEDTKPAPGKDDEPTLPVTGGALAGLVAAGIATLGAGGAALYLSRKRKAAADASEV
ncbi:thioester domain-containing protein [Nocardiopsis sp. MG754419]|uniref:thioester domain-containing protein n=1 Tax=Nocardiopsis sp. MG754419 TaxID=2259865 RepID=UPI0027DD5504|nr:thioester domain-containing protein [Nocardiopsis sp. MG754419]